ncbi:uncharacterized protein RJT20DRAFT_54897 [Scheffersomyces xylosifermentans]|uniref:uncharacterized protein n=1 Tax=Scheffersomyces xylosifermentans TaxID=1304137 RepID=UPI00315C6546
MASEYVLSKPQVGVIHTYGPNLTAFEFTTTPTEPAPNVVLFVGGLGNGLLDVPYLPPLAERLRSLKTRDGNWVLIQILIRSSYSGWGTSSLRNDTRDISALIKYLRSPIGGNRKKIILHGHSTGCQDTLEYLSVKSYEPDFDSSASVDGGILQAPVSDSEAFRSVSGIPEDKFDQLVKVVEDEYLAQGKKNVILPEKYRKLSFSTPISAYRFHSLASKRGDDDYFSSYLTEEDYKKSFGKVKKPLLVLYGSKDEFVPDYVDKEKLVSDWKQATDPTFWSPLSKLLKGAIHNIGPGSDEGAEADFIETVVSFIQDL